MAWSRFGSRTIPAWALSGMGALVLGLAAAVPWLGVRAGIVRWAPVEAVGADGAAAALRPELVWVPAGRFWMGSPEGEGAEDEHPRHEVAVSRFAMCRTEVTQGQYFAVTGERPSECEYGCGDDLPVQNVSWFEAVEYLNRLSEREGSSACYAGAGAEVARVEGCTGYRLPTEAEWEYAARAGTSGGWSFGEEGRVGEHAWYGENSDGRVHPVGTRVENPWGLYDMHGNLWEWVGDWYGDYVDNAGAMLTDPMGVSTGDSRVLRGGSFDNPSRVLRSALRNGVPPSLSSGLIGFRCARGPAPQP